VVPDQKPTVHPGLSGIGAHHVGSAPTPQQQIDGVDDQGLAGTGFAGEYRETGAQHQVQVLDDPELFHVQFAQHDDIITDP